jgi:hypothetical protein
MLKCKVTYSRLFRNAGTGKNINASKKIHIVSAPGIPAGISAKDRPGEKLRRKTAQLFSCGKADSRIIMETVFIYQSNDIQEESHADRF